MVRDDISINVNAVEDLEQRLPGLELLLIESGGDNLAATFSTELVDYTMYVIDVAGGEKIPRKGGPAQTYSDLLLINKIDLAELVGASVDVMLREAQQLRGERPVLPTALRHGTGVEAVLDWVVERVRQGVRPDGLTPATGQPLHPPGQGLVVQPDAARPHAHSHPH